MDIPTVSSFRVEKPGKSKFAPSIGGRKSASQTSSTQASQTAQSKTEKPALPENIVDKYADGNENYREVLENMEGFVGKRPEMPQNVGQKILSIESRRAAGLNASQSQTQPESLYISSKIVQDVPVAAALATAGSSVPHSQKRTMAYFLKDSREGREMSEGLQGSSQKTRQVVNLKNIKAPKSSMTTIAPQVRVVDGKIVYDEELSNIVETTSPVIDETELEYAVDDENSHLTSATYAKKRIVNRWKEDETDFFYEALEMCGTDFSMIASLFPHRTRAQIKGKYKIEEKSNPSKINTALKRRKPFDSEFSARLQEYIGNI